MDNELFSNVDKYIDYLFQLEDEALSSAIKLMDEAQMPQISVSPVQGKFLQVLAKLCNAENILEIGTLGGYSTIWMARALPDDGKLITIELEAQHAEIAQKNIERAGLKEKVEIKIGEALEVLKSIDGTFDMFFLDAHKPSYTKYFEWALKHSHSGTLIVTDNVIRQGDILDINSEDENVIGTQHFNDMLASCKEVSAAIIPTVGIKGYDGIAIAVVN